MKNRIRNYLVINKSQLDNKVVDEINIYASPSAIEDVFGDFDDNMDTNGWQQGYWVENREYTIAGSNVLWYSYNNT
ncbi:MAG: hypothetical protein ACRCX8_05055 [Sarcina sp.]